jgi:hypothetical protein
MIQLGSEFGQKYIRQLGFIDSHFKPENFFIRSTDYRRTIDTAQCLIVGMYPSVQFSQFYQEKDLKNKETGFPRFVILLSLKATKSLFMFFKEN